MQKSPRGMRKGVSDASPTLVNTLSQKNAPRNFNAISAETRVEIPGGIFKGVSEGGNTYTLSIGSVASRSENTRSAASKQTRAGSNSSGSVREVESLKRLGFRRRTDPIGSTDDR